jgi:uncharacterized protein (DUF302 family)
MGQIEARHADGITTKPCPYPVDETVNRLTHLAAQKGLTIFAVVDHSGEARRVDLEMADTKLVIFGSPVAGTPVMMAAPLAALDLPLKILVWADPHGAVSVSYNTAHYLATRHHLTDDLRARLDGIESIADAVIAISESS